MDSRYTKISIELAELDEKRRELADFLAQGQPPYITDHQWELLNHQEDAMATYAMILQERLADIRKHEKESV